MYCSHFNTRKRSLHFGCFINEIIQVYVIIGTKIQLNLRSRFGFVLLIIFNFKKNRKLTIQIIFLIFSKNK